MRILKNKKHYGTIKRGKIKFDIGSKEDIFLHTKKLSHSHVTIKLGIKKIRRY